MALGRVLTDRKLDHEQRGQLGARRPYSPTQPQPLANWSAWATVTKYLA